MTGRGFGSPLRQAPGASGDYAPPEACQRPLYWAAAGALALLALVAAFEFLVYSDVFHAREQRRLGNVDALRGVRPAQLI